MSHEIHDERKKLAKHLIEAEDDFAHHWGLLQEAELAVLGAQDRLKERQEFFHKASWCLEQAKAAMFATLNNEFGPMEPAAEEAGEGAVETDEPFEAGDETDEEYEPEEVGFRDYTVYDKTTPDTITIAASEQHAEESARAQDLPPLLPPEPPPAATPEQLEATGVIDGEAGWWARKLTREPA